MRKFVLTYLILFVVYFLFTQVANAENIHFNDSIYHLKYSDISPANKVVENEYFQPKEYRDYWTSMVGIYYYPEVSNPLKYAAEFDKKIGEKENFLLLKFIRNKKQDIALLSYLENIVQNDKTFFIYHICKYEKHPKKGMMILRFAKKYVFNTKEEITSIGHEVKSINDDYMEKLIISPIPPIVQKQIP